MTENAHSTYSRTPRVLVVGDIGQHAYHVGDEAMTMAAARFLHEGGCSVTLMTRDERHSARYLNAPRNTDGGGYSYLPFFLFPWSPAERELTLEAIERILRELYPANEGGAAPRETDPTDLLKRLLNTPEVRTLPEPLHPAEDTVRTIIDWARAVATADAVLISGGGNLNSRFGWLLYERAAVTLATEYAGVPLFVTGQSLGPVLNPEDAQVLERMLRTARSVTVRESSSLAWCRERDIDARLSVDDATDYPVASPARTLHYAEGISASQALNELPEHYVCVTVNECTDQQAQQIARLLDGMWREHGYAPVFLSHYGDPQDSANGDIQAHQRIAERLSPSTPVTLLPILHADQSVAVHRAAAFTLTSRYHPAVFSAAAGIPVLALIPDAFTQMRVGGALSQYGLGEFTLPLGMLAGGVPELMVATALRHAAVATDARRTELLEALRAERAYLLTQILAHGEEKPGKTEAPAPFPAATQVLALPEPLATTVRAARDLFTATSLTAGFEWAMSDRAHSWDAVHRAELERLLAEREEPREAAGPGDNEPRGEARDERNPEPPEPENRTGFLRRVARRIRG